MKLLGLHGHLQNAARMKGQTNALMRHLKKAGVEVIFIDAPFICPDGPEASPFRTWVEGNSIEASLQTIIQAKEAHPEAVGLFAFSMGAMLALKCAAHASANVDSPFSWIKIIVSASAPFPADDSPLLIDFPYTCAIPVLFVIGNTDQIAPPESQKRYLPSFSNATVFEHEGGHYIPSARPFVVEYTQFFEKSEIKS